MSFIYVGIGAFFGSILRAIISDIFNSKNAILGTTLSNILAAFFIGIFTEICIKLNIVGGHLSIIMISGFCGSLSTFSSTMFDIIEFIKVKKIYESVAYFMVNISFSIICAYLGLYIISISSL